MKKVHTFASIEFSATFTLSETELRAIEAFTGYGDDAFLAAFKEKLGSAYIREHESGIRSFFEAVRRDVHPALREIDVARRDLRDAAEARAAKAGA